MFETCCSNVVQNGPHHFVLEFENSLHIYSGFTCREYAMSNYVLFLVQDFRVKGLGLEACCLKVL